MAAGLVYTQSRQGIPAVDDVLDGGEETREAAQQESREIAENWIETSSPTYTHDGSDLTFISEDEITPGRYLFVFSFTSSSAGYGDRSDQMTAQVITPHTIEVTVEDGELVSAVTDEVYDELAEEMIDEEAPETLTIDLYFVRVVEGQEEVVSVEREIPYTTATARAAIDALLEGPTAAEQDEGVTTSIPEGTELQSIEIENGTVRADFSEELDEGTAGSATVTAIREQIEQTLLQFETVNDVMISVNGETETILQP